MPMRQICIGLLMLLLLIDVTVAQGAAPMRDPTKPPDYKEQSQSAEAIGRESLVVNTIIYSKQRKVAVVNGQFLQAGDKISGFEVVEITPQMVRFKGEEGEFELSLVKHDVKTRSKQKVS